MAASFISRKINMSRPEIRAHSQQEIELRIEGGALWNLPILTPRRSDEKLDLEGCGNKTKCNIRNSDDDVLKALFQYIESKKQNKHQFIYSS